MHIQHLWQYTLNLLTYLQPLQTKRIITMPAAQTPAAHLFDVLIVGGGPAGLSAAIGLARQLYSAVVFDNGVYRNAGSKHMHNVATWDHVNPMEFRKKAREDIQARYNTIKFENTTVDTLYKTPKGIFEATDIRGNVWAGRKVILASGVKDIFPEIEGYGDAWIKGM